MSCCGGDTAPQRALPQRADATSKRKRANDLADAREAYALEWPWGKDASPAWLAKVPSSEEPIGDRLEFYTKIGGGYTPTLVKESMTKLWNEWTAGFTGRAAEIEADPFKKYDLMFAKDDVPSIAKVWRTDESFGDQRINGLYPEFIERCNEVPAGFEEADAALEGLGVMPSGTTLAAAAKEGTLYMTNLREYLSGAPGRTDKDVVTEPIVLFYSDTARGALLPVAIQLREGGAVFTPKDDADGSNRWLAAKMHANRAQFSLHLPVNHFLYFHQILGRLYIGMRRQIAPEHPLWELMERHFQNHLFANTVSRETEDFGNPRARFVAEKEWKCAAQRPGGHFGRLELPRNLEARGVADATKLPNFRFRDEALKMWAAFEVLVRGFVEAVYGSDAAVAEDTELNAWAAEVSGPEGGITGLPLTDGKFTTQEQLRRVLTTIIFCVCSHHSFSTTAGADYYAYIPNAPVVFSLPPPEDHDVRYTLQQLCDGLPGDTAEIRQSAGISGLQVFDFAPLVPLPKNYLESVPKAAIIRAAFTAATDKIESQSPASYPYLRPSKTSACIWH